MRRWLWLVWSLAAVGAVADPPHRVTRETIHEVTRDDMLRQGWADPRFSPDGRTLLYRVPGIYHSDQGSDDRLYVSSGGQARELAEHVSSAAWSPHGRRIRYIDHDRRLWTVRPDGTDAGVRATDASEARWSPRGHRIAYVTQSDDYRVTHSELRLIDPDGAEPQTILVGSSRIGYQWSPDSRYLTAWLRSPGDGTERSFNGNGRARSFLIDEQAGTAVRIESPLAGAAAGEAALSKDNRYLALATYGPDATTTYPKHDRQGNTRYTTRQLAVRLWLQDRRTGDWTRLATREGWRVQLTWAPDGQRLATSVITVEDCGTRADLAIWDTSGRQRGPWLSGYDALWSPGGKRLAWRHHEDGHGGGILVCDNVGERVTKVGKYADYPGGFDWTPDGMALVLSYGSIVEKLRIER